MDMLLPIRSSRPKNSAKYVAKGSAYSESCMSPFSDLSNFAKYGREETHMSRKSKSVKSETFKIKDLKKKLLIRWDECEISSSCDGREHFTEAFASLSDCPGCGFALRNLWMDPFQPYGNVNFRKHLRIENLTFPVFCKWGNSDRSGSFLRDLHIKRRLLQV